MDFSQNYDLNKKYIEDLLLTYLPKAVAHAEVLNEAMSYSLMAGGKRIRPIIMLETFRMYAEDTSDLEPFMAAIEMIHTYSLIHDDLPALDNDDLRRGAPTCHIKFGEDIAILAGDALLNQAYENIGEFLVNHPDVHYLQAFRELVKAAGNTGMIIGQVADVLNENKQVSLELLDFINLSKTAALLTAAFTVGAFVAKANIEDVELLREVGKNLGLAFQIQDDILDLVGNEEDLGKPVKSDIKNDKNTYVSLLGIEKAKKEMEEKYNKSINLLTRLKGEKSEFLISLITSLKTRSY